MIHAYCIIFVFQLLSLTGAMESSIVGGKVAKPHSRPYMASLQIRKSHRCGGMLIREDFVLTAAHCKLSEQMTVVLGAHNIKKKEKSQQWIEAEYIPHPKYTGQHEYDIMLLKLKKKATLNKYVMTIGLPEKDEKIQANIMCDVAGWGKTNRKSRKPSKLLRETKENLQSDETCKNKWREYFNPADMLCTTFTKKKGGICQGDSGGPLICNTKLQGITAFTSENCKDPEYPHGFTKIQFFLPWIKEVMQG